MDLSIFFAGTGGSVPTARRGLPSTLIRAGGDRLLVDCGEGTQRQLLRSTGLPDVDAVFITHFHLDHWFGLPGMLKTMDLRGRDKPLEVYGPPGLRALFDGLRSVYGRVSYRVGFTDLERYEEVRFGNYSVTPFPVEHRIAAFGYALIEDERPGRFDLEAARALGLEPGPDYKRLQAGEAVGDVTPDQVIGAPRAGRKLVFSGDTAPCQGVEAFAQHAEVLVHEATFTEDERDRARATGHSTAAQAAETARDAGVRLLALTHLSTRFFPREIRDEARAVFPRTLVPRDFDAIEIPFPERGEPRLTKFDEAGAVSADAPDDSFRDD